MTASSIRALLGVLISAAAIFMLYDAVTRPAGNNLYQAGGFLGTVFVAGIILVTAALHGFALGSTYFHAQSVVSELDALPTLDDRGVDIEYR